MGTVGIAQVVLQHLQGGSPVCNQVRTVETVLSYNSLLDQRSYFEMKNAIMNSL